MKKLKKIILNLFGIEAILPKGTACVIIEKGGKLEANGPSSFENLSFVNLSFHVLDDKEGFAMTPNVKNKKGVLLSTTIPSSEFWKEVYKTIDASRFKNRQEKSRE